MINKARWGKLFYGNVIIAFSCLIMAIAWGANRTFGVFLSPLTQEFGWSRAGISGAFTMCMIILGIMSLAVGRLTDRLGPRPLIVACSLFTGVGFFMCSRMGSQLEFYFYFGVFTGIGLSGVYVPLYSMVVRWFVRRRSLMSGILAAGPAMGIVFMPPLATWLISSVGWRTSFVVIGALTLLTLWTSALFLKRDPGQIGAMPFGMEEAKETWAEIQNHGIPMRDAVRTRPFWLLNFISFVDVLLVNVVIVHIVPYAISLSIDPLQASTILSLAAGVSIPARIGMGALADNIGNHRGLLFCISMSVFAFVMLILAGGTMALYLFAVVYGIGLWTSGAVMSPFIADLFGLKAHGAILSCTFFSGAIGGSLGPVLIGYIFDLTGSYRLGFALCIIAALLSFISILGIASPLSRAIRLSTRSG